MTRTISLLGYSVPARPALVTVTAAALLAGCLGDVEVPPEPPALLPVASPTAVPRQTLSGTKPRGTAVLNHGTVIVPLDDAEAWSYDLALSPGDNSIRLTSERASGRASRKATVALIEFQPPCPTSPTLAAVPAFTQQASVVVSGSKEVGTSIAVNGVVVVQSDDAPTWQAVIALSEGANTLSVTSRDANDHDSDPVQAVVTRDASAPHLLARVPSDTATGVPTNGLVRATFDEALAFPAGAPDASLLTVVAANGPVSGSLSFHFESHTLVFSPTSALDPATAYTVTIAASEVVDRAGNVAAPAAAWQWTFTTGAGADVTPPPTPTVDNPGASVSTATVVLTGTKGAFTSVWLAGTEIVPVDPMTQWSYPLALTEGENAVTLTARSVTDTATPGPSLTITRTTSRPSPPTLASTTPSTTGQSSIILGGSKPSDTSVVLNGNTVVCRTDDVDWGAAVTLVPGTNELTLQTRDASGVLSDPLRTTVDFAQTYAGTVPETHHLQVFFSLRDLSEVDDIVDEFGDGPNFYGVDVWLEGPLAAGETCVMSQGARQNIDYVATLVHYIGTKEQHRVPFVDADYRGGDYLASLISADVFAFLGLSAQTARRDGTGKQAPSLLDGLTESQLRSSIDCLGQVGVDACTQATSRAGAKTVGPWTPRRRGGHGLLEQGEYLLHVLINLDRDPGWVASNDYETCWDAPADFTRGAHRFAIRVALGDAPYTLRVSQSAERSGPDREGSEKLRYVTPEGVTVYWGP